jgi:hypothetical protein
LAVLLIGRRAIVNIRKQGLPNLLCRPTFSSMLIHPRGDAMNPLPGPKTTRGKLPRHPLFRLLLVNGLAGAALGVLFVVGILVIDVAGIRNLLAGTGEWVIGLALLTMGSVTTFASVAMGGAIMLIPKPRDSGADDSTGGHGALVPVRVRPRPARSEPPRRWTD